MKNLMQYPLDYLIGSVHYSDIFPVDHSIGPWLSLTEEQKANSKKARQTGTRTQTTPTKRERKEDTDKRFLISVLYKTLADNTNDAVVDITNPERQIDFEHNGRKFRVVLSAPRS